FGFVEQFRNGRALSTMERGDLTAFVAAYLLVILLLAASVTAAVMGLRDINWVGRIAIAFLAVQLTRSLFWHVPFSPQDIILTFVICFVSEIGVNVWRAFRAARQKIDEYD